MKPDHVLYFGKHMGKTLDKVPSDYLLWLLAEAKLSAGLRAAVGDELRERGRTPPEPPPQPIPSCGRCGPGAGFRCAWQEDRLGRRHVRAECARCGRFLGFAPKEQPYAGMADAAASPTPVLDVLVRLEDLGVQLHSDGASVYVPGRDRHRVPPDLHSLIRQCAHQLARLLKRLGRSSTARHLRPGPGAQPF
jgi:hypothetical protein